MDEAAGKLQAIINGSRNIVFFGGAGVSTESGIPDFRSTDGLYSQHYRYPPEYMLSRTCFDRQPDEFFRFYRDKILAENTGPNPAHLKLARLEQAGRLQMVITQNIDGLHQAAGSKNVVELHGSIHRNYCQSCGTFYNTAHIKQAAGAPVCRCGGFIKPDVVLYEEPLDETALTAAVRAISGAEVLIIGGTSLVVYPAAGLVDYFSGRHLVVINKSAIGQNARAGLVIAKPIGEVMRRIQIAE